MRNPVCELGWTQKKTQTQSELVSANWSPNGWLISTGSADPDINIFDIRVNREDPTHTISNAHTNRVFKAAWHPHQPLLISISSDHLLGLHSVAC